MCQSQKTAKVHLPATLALACVDCNQSARTFTYRRTKLREEANGFSEVDGRPVVVQKLEGGNLYSDPRKIASVRTWRWTCEGCGKVVQVENRIDLGPNGERGPVQESVTVNDPMVAEGMFGDAPVGEIGLSLNEDLSLKGTFLDRDGAH